MRRGFAVGLGSVVLVSDNPITPEQRAAVLKTMRVFGIDAATSAKVVSGSGSIVLQIHIDSVTDPR